MKLEIDEQEAIYIYQVLSTQPIRDAGNLYTKIGQQIQAHQEAKKVDYGVLEVES